MSTGELPPSGAALAREELEAALWHRLPPHTSPRVVGALLALADTYAAVSCGEVLDRDGAPRRQAERRARLAAEVREAYGHLTSVTRPERGRAAA